MLDQIFMLFSYENRKKKRFFINFSSPRLKCIKASNFTSSWYNTALDGRLGIEKLRDQRSCIDVAAVLSLVSRFAWFRTQPEVKFDNSIRLKRGEEKLIRIFFRIFTREQHKDLIEQIIHLKNLLRRSKLCSKYICNNYLMNSFRHPLSFILWQKKL